MSIISDPASRTYGFWLFAADGGVFAEDGAPYFGSAGAERLNQPVIAGLLSGIGSWYTIAGMPYTD